MKRIIFTLALLLSLAAKAQQPCQVFLDKMADKIAKEDLGAAKILMKGYINCIEQSTKNNEIIKRLNQLSYIKPFDGDAGIAAGNDGRTYFIINKNLTTFIPLKYRLVDAYFTEGVVMVITSFDNSGARKYGLVDRNGKEIVPPKYDHMDFSEGIAKVRINGKYGYIDKTGQEITPVKYDQAYSFSKEVGLAKVIIGERPNDKLGFVDKTGKEIIPVIYDNAYGFGGEGLTLVVLKNKFGFLDKTGAEAIPVKYDYAYSFSEGLAMVCLNGYGFIDKTGKIIIPLKYETSVMQFKEGLAGVRLNGKWGFIDKTGKEIIPFKFDGAYNYGFSEGLTGVKLNGKWGFIDKMGKEVIPFRYDEVGNNFYNGRAHVKLNGKYFYIDKSGKCMENCP